VTNPPKVKIPILPQRTRQGWGTRYEVSEKKKPPAFG